MENEPQSEYNPPNHLDALRQTAQDRYNDLIIAVQSKHPHVDANEDVYLKNLEASIYQSQNTDELHNVISEIEQICEGILSSIPLNDIINDQTNLLHIVVDGKDEWDELPN